MRNTMEIACATDERYAPHCATMLRSLIAHNTGADIRVHILHGKDLGEAARMRLRGFLEAEGVQLNLLAVPDELIAGFPGHRFHISCWYRVLLPVLLPQADRALYLDSDMVIASDLRPLWNTDLGGALFAAVVNPLYPFNPNRPAALGLGGPTEYLNSGVMLMDLARMRAERLVEKLREYACRHPDNPYPEQDALSVVCRGRWQPLPPRWNAQSTLFDMSANALPFPADEVAAARSDPAVVHFIGPLKPWHYLCRHPLRHLYEQHRRNTPWPDFEPEGRTWANRLLRPLGLGAQLRIRAWLRPLSKRLRQALLRGPRVMKAFARSFPDARFVQVGSNDGSKHDPLRAAFLRSNWSGVLVEPVPYVFERLRANYQRYPRARLENVAVAEQSGSLPFFHLAKAGDGENLPSWYDELGSFRKEVVLKHADRIPDLERRLVTTQVPCVTFAELCSRNHLQNVDLLHTDAEGYDDVILGSIDFERFRPTLLVYEHKHLDAARREACRRRLQELGYQDFAEGQDTWCIDARVRGEPHAAFMRRWRRIAGAGAAP